VPRLRHLGLLAATFMLIAAAIGIGPATAQSPVREVAGAQLAAPAPVTITGLDLHDGQVVKFGSTYYLYGTEYACGFQWYTPNTSWCGFGVSTAPSLSGPWSTPTLLFPASAADPYNPGKTYQATCGLTGQGCFSPRMIQRSGWGANDGVYVLWFNAPWYYSSGGATHAYMAMGCNGPAGPCGASAGAPYGSTHRPNLHQCAGANGDAGLLPADGSNPPALLCPMAGNSGLGEEQLSYWGADGSGTGSIAVAGLKGVEAMGGWKDPASGTWVMTYSDPGCGYCTGTSAGYATSPSQLGPWAAPGNLGAGAPANGRRAWTANSCGGQVDTVSVLDGVPWQKLDIWTGSNNETSAALHFEPLTYTPTGNTPGDGQLWRPAIAPLACN
jgi:hypothetical protein